jgi:hypothetical protein
MGTSGDDDKGSSLQFISYSLILLYILIYVLFKLFLDFFVRYFIDKRPITNLLYEDYFFLHGVCNSMEISGQ